MKSLQGLSVMKLKKKITISFKAPKQRDMVAYDLFTNGLYKHKVIKSKKAYDRKKLKKIDLKGEE